MQAGIGKFGLVLAAVLALGACGSDKEPKLMNVRAASSGPDEFGILPTKPLQMPASLAALPPPTPGGSNLTDPTPEADAIAALGGKPAVLARGIAAADAGLMAHVAKYGSSADIRAVLAAEDLEYRRKNNGKLLERLFNVNVYYQAYLAMSLDQAAEIERWRKLGIRTVGAPPEPALLRR
ncbi:DUF3035 domain-containing protein [Phaeovulum sp.]|jgi:hypothetical protein|uniref:DUF3035 domain-containing protein n=1 Tax=Phaeovulum sp. TaxID=2934796 RepID=UPI00272F4CE6|nr:DUF3035 domain-containing protein [Phaeovulum sp.]MDP1668950.1 DUF3035 domain-containing protein [Phaeovulum sp.]MDP2061886.1 DUF3035 domain-containing protein [Phaeovulum sp.]MDP3862469.1 DUF3035 domain-containing protein [Phaeovulum sp.]MDZ4119221.1 DUF3035 domain-containing protein [Phaeovulum sp.]